MSYRNAFKKNVVSYEKTTKSKYIQLIFVLEKEILENFFHDIRSKNKSVMDFACGSGRWTQYLEKKFRLTTGVDVSEEMIKYAKKKCSNTNFILTDITTKSRKKEVKNKFNVITAFRFYKNAEETLRGKATKEISKYLKNEGYFIFDLHLNTFSFMGIFANTLRLLKLDKLFHINPLAVKTVSLSNIKKMLKKNSLEVLDYYGMGFLPSRSNYLILPPKLLYKIESYFTHKKIFRDFSYNLLLICRKIKP